MKRKERIFTFVNNGQTYQFKALKEVYDHQVKKRQTLLDVHRDLVRLADSPRTYILDDSGIELKVH